MLCTETFSKSFPYYVGYVKSAVSNVINIYGKTIRNSGKDKPLHIVSAWCQNNQMVFAQEKIHKKSNRPL
jgi:hypothetical protein